VVRQSRYFHKEDKKYHFITFFIGQSLDDGETWKFFDVNYTTVAKINYQFPEIFGDLAIQEPTILTPEQEAAAQQAAVSVSTTKKQARRKK
jgi:GH18 family chitinase